MDLEGLQRVRHIFVEVEHRGVIHEVTRVDSDILTKLFVRAQVAATLRTLILDIVDNQTSIMDDLRHATPKVYIFIRFKVFEIVTPQAPGHDESKDGPPLLATSIEHVVDGNVQCLINGLEIGLVLCRLFKHIIRTATLLEHAREGRLE